MSHMSVTVTAADRTGLHAVSQKTVLLKSAITMTTCSNEPEKWQMLGLCDALITMFRTEPTDPTEKVQSKLNHLLNTFLEAYRSTTADEKNLVRAQKCCYEAKVWYYKILESLLQKDQRPRLKNGSSFLEDHSVQCSLVLCCLEISLCSNKIAYHFTPHLLQIFVLAPYNLWKVIILVLHTQTDLTLDVTEHLLKVVEMIVGSLALTSDSPLWEKIRLNNGKLPSCKQVMSAKELEDPMRMEQLDQDPISNTDPTTDQQHSSLNRRYSFLDVFARTLYKIAHKRLRTLCSALNLQEKQQQQIWTCLEHSLVHHFDTLRDGHLDWLLLCAIHSITENPKDELSFAHILNCYKSMPHKHKKVSKTRLMLREQPERSHDDETRGGSSPTNSPTVGHEHERVTRFYSQVYTPAMGNFVKMFAPSLGVLTPPLSPYPAQPSPSTRKYRVRCNVYVSTLCKQTASPQPAGMQYVFHSSPLQCLRDMSVKVHGPPVKRGRELQFDDEDGDRSPSAKMMKRIQEVEDDRRQTKQLEPSSDH
ncbi:retinoblastoma-like protein 2 [Eucyclogobius newberryi]|uniref:retinoblastoma-like protein 2 n=1 Tax=Eucyclogobius newberryi TaxID=166745 RepID=UPI003B59BBA4